MDESILDTAGNSQRRGGYIVEHIGYTQRICTDQEKINSFLSEERAGVIGMLDKDHPYAVPVNYIWHKGSIYFHGMGSGKKVNILSQYPEVTFTIFKEYGTVTDPVPCHADTSYMSVMIFGKAERVSDSSEAAEALQKLVDKFMPDFYKQHLSSNLIEKYRSSMDGKAVSVFRITPVDLTAKENLVSQEKLFHGHGNMR